MRAFPGIRWRQIRPHRALAVMAIVAGTGAVVFKDELLETPDMQKATNAAVTMRLQHIAAGPVVAFRNEDDCARQGLKAEFCYAALLSYSGTIRQFSLLDDPYAFKGSYLIRGLIAQPQDTFASVADARRACGQVHGVHNCTDLTNGASAASTFVMRQGETDPAKIEIVWPLRQPGGYLGRDGKSYDLRF